MRHLPPILLAAALAGVATPAAPAAAGPTSPVAAAAVSREMTHARLIRQCANRERGRRGIATLRYDADLAKAARVQSRDMAQHRSLDHTDSSGRDPFERVQLFTDRFFTVGENIFSGRSTAATACRWWMRSPGHRAAILNPEFTSIGTGVARGGMFGRSWVQVFGTEGSPPEEPTVEPEAEA